MAENAFLNSLYANAPLKQRYIAKYMGNLPPYGTLFGKSHMDPARAASVKGNARPFTPGEYIENPSGGWSSEISITVPHPTKPGRWTNIPSVWLVDGVPKRLTQDEAMQAAANSNLNWPDYPTAQTADAAAATRETDWGALGREGAGKAPPLWNR